MPDDCVESLPQVRVTEWVETTSEPTIRRNGVQQFRTRQRDRFAVLCMTCGATKHGGTYVETGQWKRKHRCDLTDVAAMNDRYGTVHNDGDAL